MAARNQSLERALDILELLGEHGTGMRVNEICDSLGLNKSTVSRMLATLAEREFVEKLKDGSYRIGVRIIEISSIHLNSLQLKTEALPYMEELQNKTGLIVHLATMMDKEIVYLEKLSPTANLRMYSQIGKRAFMHSTGLGKAMMAFMGREEIKNIIREKGLPRVTEHTITDETTLLKELDLIHKRGYAFDEEENEIGVRCIAAPIFDYRGQVIAAVSACGFLENYQFQKSEEFIQEVVECVKKISKAMGWRAK